MGTLVGRLTATVLAERLHDQPLPHRLHEAKSSLIECQVSKTLDYMITTARSASIGLPAEPLDKGPSARSGIRQALLAGFDQMSGLAGKTEARWWQSWWQMCVVQGV